MEDWQCLQNAPLFSEAHELTVPFGKGLVLENWSTSKKLYSPDYHCLTDCICGLGSSHSLPRHMGASKPRDTQDSSTESQEVPGNAGLGLGTMRQVWTQE